jgi:hypothetical protein
MAWRKSKEEKSEVGTDEAFSGDDCKLKASDV